MAGPLNTDAWDCCSQKFLESSVEGREGTAIHQQRPLEFFQDLVRGIRLPACRQAELLPQATRRRLVVLADDAVGGTSVQR